MKKLLIASAFAVSAFAVSAQTTTSDMYVSVGRVHAKIESDVGTINPTANQLTIGKNINSNVAVEGTVMVGSGTDNIGVATYDIKPSYGAYVKYTVPFTNNISGHARVGVARNKLSGSAYGQTVSETKTGLAGGVGVDVELLKEAVVSVDYMKYDTGASTDTTAVIVTLNIKF